MTHFLLLFIRPFEFENLDQSDPLAVSFDDPQNELSYLDGLAAKAKVHITQSLELLARIHLRRNLLMSLIYTLPPEILSCIFQNINQTNGDIERSGRKWEEFTPVDRFAVVLSHVSSDWRQLALHTPELWTTVTLRIRNKKSSSHALLLQHYLTRAKSFDISLNIFFEEERPRHTLISRLLFSSENAHRIRVLRVQNPPLKWIPLLSKFRRVQTLCLTTYPIRSTHDDITLRLPMESLRQLLLVGLRGWDSVTVSQSLQFVSLKSTSPDVELALLRQCPNMIDFHSEEPTGDEFTRNFPALRFNTPYVYNKLSSFTWTLGEWIDSGSAVRNLFLPVLQKLHLTTSMSTVWEHFIGFIHKHAKTLLSLKLESLSHWGSLQYNSLFEHDMPHLRHITLIARFSELICCIEALTPRQEDIVTGETLVYLPGLKSLCLEENDPSDPAEEMDRLAPLALEMLLRRSREEENFEFEMDIPDLGSEYYPVVWPKKVRDAFIEYLAGRCVKITQGSELPKFLVSENFSSWSDSSSDVSSSSSEP